MKNIKWNLMLTVAFTLTLSSCYQQTSTLEEQLQNSLTNTEDSSQSETSTETPTGSDTSEPDTVTDLATYSDQIKKLYPDAVPLWEASRSEGAEWTNHVMTTIDTLGTNLITTSVADGSTFCSKYSTLTSLQRKIFWTYFISNMVKYESGFDPTEYYAESFADSSGNAVVSRGLLQISIESSKGYSCGFANENEIHDATKNLSCGIRILNKWIGSDVRIAGYVSSKWRGGARYWSVLRTSSSSYSKILSKVSQLSFCK